MGSKSETPTYPTTTVNTGLFGKSTTNQFGSSFKPTSFQKRLVGITENNAEGFLKNYLNPDYESGDYKRGDDYYTNKMQNELQNTYLSPALANNLMRGSTASDVMRGFATDLANNEYNRQNDYANQQLQRYQAAMLPYTTVYDMMRGTQGLSSSLANSIANYNLNAQSGEQESGFGSLLGGIGTLAGGAAGAYFGGPAGAAAGASAGNTAGSTLGKLFSR